MMRRPLGFILLVLLGPRIVAAQEASRLHPPPPSPVSPGELEAAIARGVDYLVRTQNRDGSWGSPRWTGGVDIDPVPGAFHSFGTATTALGLEALLGVEPTPEVRKAAEKAEAYLLDNLPKLRRADPGNLPNIWAYCYGIQALSELARRAEPGSERRGRLEASIRARMDALKHFETVHGGWFYYASGFQRPLAPSASFVNSAVLVALDRARPLGLSLDEKVLKRSIAATAAMRKPDSSYLYTMEGPLGMSDAMMPINRPAGSLGRSQACNLALRLWGDDRITDAVLKDWLDRLIVRNGWLDMGRKRPIPHESFAQVAGYFFYFGHYYAALGIGQLPEADRPFYQDHLARLLIRLQEGDGSWFDYPLYSYHKPYGTAFALMALQNCRKAAGPR
jgi:hypothetical protein